MGLLLAKSGRQGSSHRGWFSFWDPRCQATYAFAPALTHVTQVAQVKAYDLLADG